MRGFDKGDLVAFSPNGTRLWRYETGYYITSDPAVGDDGTIYIGSGDTYFYAVYPNGTLRWRFQTGHYVKGPASIDEDGIIYIGSYDDHLYALYPDGTMKWQTKINTGPETNPSFSPDGKTIYVGDDMLYALNRDDGSIKWSFDPGSNRYIFQSSPTVAADGTIFFGANIGSGSGGEFFAVWPDGTLRYREVIGNYECDSTPTIGPDGTVYIGAASYEHSICTGYLYAFGRGESNHPPDPPSVSGPSTLRQDVSYDFTFTCSGLEGDVYYLISWFDGLQPKWIGPVPADEPFIISYEYSDSGSYEIHAKVHGENGVISDWSDPFPVAVPKNKSLEVFEEFFPWIHAILERLSL
jgi:outer membrane protein assembly factor BamB